MRPVPPRLAAVLALLVCLGGSSIAGARERGILRASLETVAWPDLSHLTVAPDVFYPPFDGKVRAFGYGLGFSYHHPVRALGRGRLLLGGDVAFLVNTSGRRYVGQLYPSGVAVEGEIYANSGYLTPSALWVVDRGGRPFFWAGCGGGLYVLRFKNNIAGYVLETGQNDVAPGGFVALGARLFSVSSRLAIDVETRVHGFRFDRLGPAFPGQKPGGPLWQVGVGISGR